MKKAVLFIIFNRLDTTQKVFEQIRLAAPPKLYIASDGARENIETEKDTAAENDRSLSGRGRRMRYGKKNR